MSDTGRKDVTTKVSESITPDTHKSIGEKTKEHFTNTTDHAAAAAQPNDTKSTTQSVVDSTHDTTHKDESVTDKVKSAVGLDTKH